MSDRDDIRKLINNNRRRLQKLKEQEALYGLSVDPSIPLEIEDIKEKITELQKRLDDEGLNDENVTIPQPDTASPTEAPRKFEFTLPKRKPSLRDLRRWLQGG